MQCLSPEYWESTRFWEISCCASPFSHASVKIQASFSEGERNTAGMRHMHSLPVPCCLSDSFRALETPLHLKYDLLWESRGFFFLSLQVCKWYLRKRFKNVFSTHHTINNQLCTPFWLKLQGKEAFRKALLAFHKSQIVQERGPRADSGRHEKQFVVADWALCFWREFGIFFKKAHLRERLLDRKAPLPPSLFLHFSIGSADLEKKQQSFFHFFSRWFWNPGDKTSLLHGSIC